MKNLFIGTSGYSYNEWKGDFYPEDIPKNKWLQFYAGKFNSVEINATFYRTATKKSVERWQDNVKNDFVFTFKASQFITHTKKLNIARASYDQFYEPLEPVVRKNSKHCILFQLPQNFKKNIDRLESFLKDVPTDFRNAFEFRHPTWFDQDVYKVLRKHNTALVMNDSPKNGNKRKWPMVEQETASFFYVRFHGSKKLYASNYTKTELEHYAEICRKKLEKGLSVYAYFNNDAEGHATVNARQLREKIEKG